MQNLKSLALRLTARRQKLSANLKTNQAILLSQPADIIYFSGFDQFLLPYEREGLLYIGPDEHTSLFHSFFTSINHVKNIKYLSSCHGIYLKKHLLTLVNRDQIKELFIDEASLLVQELKILQRIEGLKLSALDKNLIWQQRMYKDSTEQIKIHQAQSLTKKILTQVISSLRVGISEKQLSWAFETECKKFSKVNLAFPTIVAFGSHSASPHHQPTEKKLKPEMPVLIDCGVKYQNYCADMTRTVWFGNKPDSQFCKIEAVVKKAYKAAKNELDKVRTGAEITAARLDQAARQVIASAGFGAQFTHTTGHGLGLEIHEPPSLNSQNPAQLKSNMVITIEPGIYLEGKFGYRFENTIIV